MHAHVLSAGKLVRLDGFEAIRTAYAAGRNVWVEIGQQAPGVEEFLVSTFGIHPLIVEDIFSERSAPKIDEFDEHVYVVVHSLGKADDPMHADLQLLDVVVGKTFVLTQHREGPANERLRDRLERNPRLLEKGPAWVAHAFIDGLVDRYEPYMNLLRKRLDDLEEYVLQRAGLDDRRDLLPELFTLRRNVQALHRSTHHQRELLHRLSHARVPQIPAECLVYFRDVYDHFTRVDERAEDDRDAIAGMVDAYLNVQSNRMNQTVKRLTLMSTVMLPLNFIASFYGMNFKHMPELDWGMGRDFAIGEMLLLAAAVWGWFRLKKWV